MKPLTFKRKKGDIRFLIKLLTHSMHKNEKPQFNQSILQDQSFFSLVKNTFMLGVTYNQLKEYPEFKNTWLEKEMKRYFKTYLEQEKANNKIFKHLSQIAKTTKIPIILLRENSFKQSKKYKLGSRFSSDVDILIKKKDIFQLDKELKKT